MASLAYDLKITGRAGRTATYDHTGPGLGGDNHLTVVLPAGELISESGLVPETLRVTVRSEDDVPADAWLDAAGSAASG